MYVITNKSNNGIIDTGKEIRYQSNGYPVIVEKNVAFPIDTCNVYEVDEIPDYIRTARDKSKYTYNGMEFGENDEWHEPLEEERIKELQEQITNLELALAELYEGGTI